MNASDVVRLCQSEPVIRALDVAYVRFSCPDLDKCQAFLEDFGLKVVHRTGDVMYSRGILGAPFHHVVHRGEPFFIGFAFRVKSLEDLHQLEKGAYFIGTVFPS
jgi:catechol 2,3-dioxygenase-like lactoylglutathione lyase family enzyme